MSGRHAIAFFAASLCKELELYTLMQGMDQGCVLRPSTPCAVSLRHPLCCASMNSAMALVAAAVSTSLIVRWH